MSARMINLETLPNCEVVNSNDPVNGDSAIISTKLVYGNEISLRVAVRHGGYHSRPHVHDSEQLNYLAEGELWIYVEGQGYHLRAGDFMRVPRMAVHWAWNRSDRPCVLYESHCPANIGNPRVRRSEEHTSELQSLMRISYAVFCLKKKRTKKSNRKKTTSTI